MEDAYTLDLDTVFVTDEPLRVDRDTALILQGGWLKKRFDVSLRGAQAL